jgi:hypothetical protein
MSILAKIKILEIQKTFSKSCNFLHENARRQIFVSTLCWNYIHEGRGSVGGKDKRKNIWTSSRSSDIQNEMWARMPPPPLPPPTPSSPFQVCTQRVLNDILRTTPLSSASCLSFSVFLCVVRRAYRRGGGGGGAESYDGEKAWSSMIHLILSVCIPQYWLPASLPI